MLQRAWRPPLRDRWGPACSRDRDLSSWSGRKPLQLCVERMRDRWSRLGRGDASRAISSASAADGGLSPGYGRPRDRAGDDDLATHRAGSSRAGLSSVLKAHGINPGHGRPNISTPLFSEQLAAG